MGKQTQLPACFQNRRAAIDSAIICPREPVYIRLAGGMLWLSLNRLCGSERALISAKRSQVRPG